VREIRSRKGMVVRADDPDSRSAGSFFKIPRFQKRTMRVSRTPPSARFRIGHRRAERLKLSAAWLMEGAGLRRGSTLGNAGLSTKHILALVNRGGATAAEIVTLARHVQTVVQDHWGLVLSPEPVFVGFPEEATLPLNAIRAPSP